VEQDTDLSIPAIQTKITYIVYYRDKQEVSLRIESAILYLRMFPACCPENRHEGIQEQDGKRETTPEARLCAISLDFFPKTIDHIS